MIYWIGDDELDVVWPMAAKMLEKAIEYADNGMTAEWIHKDLKENTKQLWMIGLNRAAAVTSITEDYGRKTANIILLGGEGMDEWFAEFMEEMDRFAKHHDCDYIVVFGREGWKRVGRKYGYAPVYTVLRKMV